MGESWSSITIYHRNAHEGRKCISRLNFTNMVFTITPSQNWGLNCQNACLQNAQLSACLVAAYQAYIMVSIGSVEILRHNFLSQFSVQFVNRNLWFYLYAMLLLFSL